MAIIGEQCEFPVGTDSIKLELQSNKLILSTELDSTIIATLTWLLSEHKNLKIIIRGLN